MIREIAIDPEAVSTWHNFEKYVLGCSFEQGRLAARFPAPEDWGRLLFKACEANEECTERHLRMIEESCIRDARWDLDARFWPDTKVRTYHSSAKWIDNVARQRGPLAFDLVLSYCNGESCAVSPDDIKQRDRRWHVKRQVKVPRDGKSIAKAIAPALAMARHVKFVDYMFRPDPAGDRFTKVLRELLLRVRAGAKVEYHTQAAEEYPKAYFRQKLRERVLPRLPRGIEVTFIRWKPERDLHERFMLTDVGGLSVDRGLDEGSGGRGSTSIKILEDSVYRDEWERLDSRQHSSLVEDVHSHPYAD